MLLLLRTQWHQHLYDDNALTKQFPSPNFVWKIMKRRTSQRFKSRGLCNRNSRVSICNIVDGVCCISSIRKYRWWVTNKKESVINRWIIKIVRIQCTYLLSKLLTHWNGHSFILSKASISKTKFKKKPPLWFYVNKAKSKF